MKEFSLTYLKHMLYELYKVDLISLKEWQETIKTLKYEMTDNNSI